MVNAIAILQSATAVIGTVYFTQKGGSSTTIHANITGAPPGLHGMHVHQYGDLSNGCESMGAHFNPYNQTHGGPHDSVKHAGDFGNVQVDDSGHAYFTLTVDSLTFEGPDSIIGRGIIFHSGQDDLGRGNETSKIAGNSGARLACGVIGIPNPNTTGWQ